jgi:hypothetical protein
MEKVKEVIREANNLASLEEAKKFLKSFQEFEYIELGHLLGYFSQYTIVYSEKEKYFEIYYKN